MRVLVTWGSKSGGTAGIGEVIAEELKKQGFEVTAKPATEVKSVEGFDAAILGGGLYANLWHGPAMRFAERHMAALRKIPVFLFSSGPTNDSADKAELPMPEQVSLLSERLGALGHVTFGGRLSPDAKGFPASAMAKKYAGDWRNFERVRAWAADLAVRLPEAKPGEAHDPPARALWRLVAYGVVGWALCAATMGGLMAILGTFWSLILHLIAAPILFWAVSRFYFRPRGARAPLETAFWFTGIVIALDAVVVAGLVLKSFEMFLSPVGTWLAFALIFGVTYLTGLIRLMNPSGIKKDQQKQNSIDTV